MKSFMSQKIEKRKSKTGFGLFAVEKIKKGDLLIDFSTGPGKFLTEEEAQVLYAQGNDYMLQIDDDLFFVATNKEELEDVDFLNHSCDPNCGIRGTLQIVAIKDINPGDEMVFDYAMSEYAEYEMKCECSSPLCRKVVTGNDWKIPELQKKYNGFFSTALQKKIDNINKLSKLTNKIS